MKQKIIFFIIIIIAVISCRKEHPVINPQHEIYKQEAVQEEFNGEIDLNNLNNYANQFIPSYILTDNTRGNIITNAGATLGRVLFYDKKLSVDNTISCGSCHLQEFAFGDTARASTGVNGKTGRHSMRLINSRFSYEEKFFWDERAPNLEFQTTQPIQDHIEMGFSGVGGNPDFDSLIRKLDSIEYYRELFFMVYGYENITEGKIQACLAQFVRSIQSFDSKFDEGLEKHKNKRMPFSNFTAQENLGKDLFIDFPIYDSTGTRISGGIGCHGCHIAPTFEIQEDSDNNGIVKQISGIGNDFSVKRAPTLRDVVKSNGISNGPFMHTGFTNDLITILSHYDNMRYIGNPNLDPRLGTASNPRDLNMTQQEKDAIIAFIATISGKDVYKNKKWANPF